MRTIANILAAACFMVLVGLLWSKSARETTEARQIEETISAIREIERTVRYKVEFEQLAANSRGWPETIDPAWFEEIPRSRMLPPEHPWLEIAPVEHAAMRNPPVRLAVSSTLAGLWYNPYQGVIRARIPVQISDARSVALYNLINGTSLRSILEPESPVDPVPPIKIPPASVAGASPEAATKMIEPDAGVAPSPSE
ncbi:MAG: hypothetical protein AB7K52_02975 [Phycisphaerales bacterium]